MGLFQTMIMALTLTLAMGQYRQAQPGYEEYETDYESPRPTHPTPRSYPSSVPQQQRQAEAPSAPKTTPVTILKQINRHNEDGSFLYGFEASDGSFKIETKQASGAVSGKYGYYEPDSGKLRVVEYGADQYGFQPAGEGITVAPPTLVDESTSKEALQNQNFDYAEYQQPARPVQQQQRPQRPIPQIAPAPARPAYRPAPQSPLPPQQQAPAQYQNEAAYSREAAPLNRPIFSPATAAAGPQSQLIRAQNEYEQAPIPQTYNQGPVQFGPPAPVREPAPAPVRAPIPQARPASGGGLLDQLARDYALPQGGSPPLHDISFGFY